MCRTSSRFRLSYVEVAEWQAERGVTVDLSIIFDRVHAFTPRILEAERSYCSLVGSHWPVDETLLKIGGRWRYVFRCLDEHGQIVDVYLTDHRDAASARAFFAGDGRGRRDADPRHEPQDEMLLV